MKTIVSVTHYCCKTASVNATTSVAVELHNNKDELLGSHKHKHTVTCQNHSHYKQQSGLN